MPAPTAKLPGHLFLASLGKTVLRPGGRKGTQKIIDHLQPDEHSCLLEVAGNMGTTAVHLAKTYGCRIVCVDLHQDSLKKAEKNIKQAGVEHLITLQRADARDLPFADETFDGVINEAMLTMLPDQDKIKALNEYYRVLKKGGKLGNHDLLIKRQPTEEMLKMVKHIMDVPLPDNPVVVKLLHYALNLIVKPLDRKKWEGIYAQTPFSKVEFKEGEMTLLTLDGLLYDEGWERTIEILQNAAKSGEARERLSFMIKLFNQTETFGHITIHAEK
jgi:ubiquinone/menaquinone biosynthesis C-methylase UbiE